METERGPGHTEVSAARTRDIVVIGASAGGVAALPALAEGLPAGLPAAVLIVQHLPSTSPRHLVEIIQRTSTLPVQWAIHGEPLRRGEIVVAPPGSHLLVENGHTILNNGPRENHAKPSINRLFRSAAAHRGNATIGVLLTGLLYDGVAGLDAIKWAGGTALVQDPREAEFPDLPTNAIATVPVDQVLSVGQLATRIGELSGQSVAAQPVPKELLLHAALDLAARADPSALDALGQRELARCPECGGLLWRMRGRHEETYRCDLGHSMSCGSLVPDQAVAREEALRTATRLLEDSAFTLTARAVDARDRGDLALATRYETEVARLNERANRQRALILEVESHR